MDIIRGPALFFARFAAIQDHRTGTGACPALAAPVEPRRLLTVFLLTLSLGCLCRIATAAPERPNIVLILADDLGYGDLSCQNRSSKIQTPRLDHLASQGVRFTDAHAPSALCTPSRYSLLTGQYCWRSRLKSGVLNMWDEPLIQPDRLTVARLLQNNGYRTACFGKWHLGLAWPFVGAIPSGFDPNVAPANINWTKRVGGGPVDCGFDYYFGVNLANQPPYAFIENDHVVGQPTVQYFTVSGQQGHWSGPGVAGWDWARTLPEITTNTVHWIQTNCAATPQPFFLYASLVGPHQPVVPSPAFQGASQAGIYGDYVQEIDWAVGELLDALETTGAATNTLVIFTSDNGPDEFAYQRLQRYQHASMGPLRGIKSDIWEGGHRVPFLARWPGHIPSGTTNAQTISLVDFMRTAADIVGAQLSANAAEDSVSFLRPLLGKTSKVAASRLLVLESGIGQFGVRSNNWMFIDSSTGDGHNPELEPLWFEHTRKYVAAIQTRALLYDLGTDLAESSDLLAHKTLLASQLYSQLTHLRSRSIWGGTFSTDWTVARNWLPQGPPGGTDVVYTNLPGVNLTQTVRTNFVINSIILDPSVGAEVLIGAAPGGQLTIANGIDMFNANANLTIRTPLALNQSQVWNTGRGHKLEIDGTLALAGSGLMICGQGDTVFANAISGDGGLRVRSSGRTVLESRNSFSGGLELSGGGVVSVRDNGALGTGGLVIPNNSSLDIAPGVSLTNSLIIQGSGAQTNGSAYGGIFVDNDGIASYEGDIVMSGDTGFRAHKSGSILSIGGTMSGSAGLTIMAGAGTILFTTNQSYWGKTAVEGRLKIAGGVNTLPSSTDVVFANSSTAQLDLNDNDQELASISGGGPQGGTIFLGRANLRIGLKAIANFNGRVSGTGNLEKLGPGTLVLGGTNDYTGRTLIREGTLEVTGSLGATPVEVAGGTLTGNGSIQGPVTITDGGVLKLTISADPMTLHNQLVLTPASTTWAGLNPTVGSGGRVQGMISTAYAGCLIISNVVPGVCFTNGQSFQLFSSAVAQGSFAKIQPDPGPGLVWCFYANRGVLTAVAPPQMQFTSARARARLISWQGQGFHLQARTNSLSVNTNDNWFDYPGGWTNPITVSIDVMQPSVFFRLVGP